MNHLLDNLTIYFPLIFIAVILIAAFIIDKFEDNE